MNTYGVIDSTGSHTDVSNAERGAKNYATRNGYTQVSIRYNNGYVACVVAIKNGKGKWVKPD